MQNFPSEGDITRESDSNLYVNPLDSKSAPRDGVTQYKGVKKSTSGDCALMCAKNNFQGSRSSLTQTTNQSMLGSRSSLSPMQSKTSILQQISAAKSNFAQECKMSPTQPIPDSQPVSDALPKHRKTRFQQVILILVCVIKQVSNNWSNTFFKNINRNGMTTKNVRLEALRQES